jgi:DNA polymerase delta subunit 3
MLYEFHRQQNGKKPGTVHATYLLSGTKRVEEPVPTNSKVKKDGEDEYMQSSPFLASSMPQIEDGSGAANVLSITLVREENLEGRRSLEIGGRLLRSDQRHGHNMSISAQYKSTA